MLFFWEGGDGMVIWYCIFCDCSIFIKKINIWCFKVEIWLFFLFYEGVYVCVGRQCFDELTKYIL